MDKNDSKLTKKGQRSGIQWLTSKNLFQSNDCTPMSKVNDKNVLFKSQAVKNDIKLKEEDGDSDGLNDQIDQIDLDEIGSDSDEGLSSDFNMIPKNKDEEIIKSEDNMSMPNESKSYMS